MTAVEKIKAAASKLNADEQVEVFRWWVKSDAFKERQLAGLKRDIVAGIDDLESERYRTYDDSNVMQLAEDIGRSGRTRLNEAQKRRHEVLSGF